MATRKENVQCDIGNQRIKKLNLNNYNKFLPIPRLSTEFPYGLAVRIPGFHPGGPGSTPGMGTIERFSFTRNFFLVSTKSI